MLIVHGVPSSRLIFIDHHGWGVHLGLRLVTPDRPGWGRSTPVSRSSHRDWVRDAEVLLDHLEVDRVAVMGRSGGAGFAMALAALLPERVVAVALLAAGCPWDRDAGIKGTPRMRFAMSRWGAPYRLVHRKVLCPFVQWKIRSDDPPELGWSEAGVVGDLKMARLQEAFHQGAPAFMTDLAAGTRWDFEVESVHQPVRFWHGDRDEMAAPALAKRLAERLPNAEFTLVPGKHGAPMTESHIALQWLEQHLH